MQLSGLAQARTCGLYFGRVHKLLAHLVLRVRCAASTFCGMTSNQLDACSMPRHHLVYTPRIPSSATAEEDLARFMLEMSFS